ncbi:unnamed protein product, partial [Onchocerca flexuosa]|uniref:CW domain-containing protein n=1 Tax=Onchocerca flexuosa TaxID=387005 RepID=A0A183H903_9BILA
EGTVLPFIADTTGEAQLELICGNNARWRAFESSINVASISCTVLDIPPIPTTTQPKPPPVTTPTILPIPTTIPCIAKWTTWESWSVCTDTCGAYGSRQRFRSCERTREDCFCLGRLSETEFCNLQPCLYPRNACRPNYMVSSVNQKFACVPIQ